MGAKNIIKIIVITSSTYCKDFVIKIGGNLDTQEYSVKAGFRLLSILNIKFLNKHFSESESAIKNQTN
jgi:hypothetical protein